MCQKEQFDKSRFKLALFTVTQIKIISATFTPRGHARLSFSPSVIFFSPTFFHFTLWNIDHPAVNNHSSTLKSRLSHLMSHLPLPTRAQSPAASGMEGVCPPTWPWPQPGLSLSTDIRLKAPPVLWLVLPSTPLATLHHRHPPTPSHSRSLAQTLALSPLTCQQRG